MKKVFKFSLFFMAAALFFAGCANESASGGGSGGSKSAIQFDLSDGDWIMEISQYSKVVMGGSPHEMTSVDHVEMTINGNDVTVTSATRKVDDGAPVDTTADWNAQLKSAKDAGNVSALAEDDSSGSSGPSPALSGIDTSKIEPTITYDENNSDEYFKVTVVNSYKYYDLFDIAFASDQAALAFFKAMVDPDDSVYQKMEVVYQKQ